MLDSAPPINVEPAIEVGIPGTDDADVTRRCTFSISSFLVEVEVVKKVVMSPTTCAWSKDTGLGFSDSAGEEGSSTGGEGTLAAQGSDPVHAGNTSFRHCEAGAEEDRLNIDVSGILE